MADETVIVTKDQRKYKTLVTDVGKAKIADAALNGKKVNIVEIAAGDGGGVYYVPTPDMTALKNEVWRGEISRKEINADSANMIDVRAVLDSTVGGFTVREAGLFDDEGALIAVCNMPDVEKAVILEGISAELEITLHVVFTDVDAVTFQVNPSKDAMTAEDVQRAVQKAIAEHDADLNAHAQRLANMGRLVVATRPRTSGKPDYGAGGGGDSGGVRSVALDVGPYTGAAEVSAVISGVLYDAKNMSADGDAVPNGAIIIKKSEE